MSRDAVKWFVVGVLATVVIAVVVSQFASSSPDGLEYVADQQGFSDQAEDHGLADAPLADYGENLQSDGAISTGIAGLVGVVVALGLGFGLFWLIRAPKSDAPDAAP